MNADNYIALSLFFFLMFFPGGVMLGYALGIWRSAERRYEQQKERFDQQRERVEQRLVHNGVYCSTVGSHKTDPFAKQDIPVADE